MSDWPHEQHDAPPTGPGDAEHAPAVEQEAPPEFYAAPVFGGATHDEEVAAATEAAKHDRGGVIAKPLLTTGAHGPIVEELAMLLDEAGYPNRVAAGLQEPTLDDGLMLQVRAFQEANGIAPHKPKQAADGSWSAPLVRENHQGIVEHETWRALLEQAGRDLAELEVHRRYPVGSFS